MAPESSWSFLNSEGSEVTNCVAYEKTSETAPVLYGGSPNNRRRYASQVSVTSDRHDGVDACACAVSAAATRMKESVKNFCDCSFSIFKSSEPEPYAYNRANRKKTPRCCDRAGQPRKNRVTNNKGQGGSQSTRWFCKTQGPLSLVLDGTVRPQATDD